MYQNGVFATKYAEATTPDRTPESAPISPVYSRRKQRRKATVRKETTMYQNGVSVTKYAEATTIVRAPESAPTSLVYSRMKQRRKATVPKETTMYQNGVSITKYAEATTTDGTPKSGPVSLMYSRRKQRRKATVPETTMYQNEVSVTKSAEASVATINQDGLRQGNPKIEFLEDALTVPVSKSKLPSYSPLTQVRFSDGNSENCMCKTRHKEGTNYGCPSLKSYKKTTGEDEFGECSSSGFVREDISAKDFCVSIPKKNGLLVGSWHTPNREFVEKEIGTNQLRKVCGKSGSAESAPESAPISLVYSRRLQRRKVTGPKEMTMHQNGVSVTKSVEASVAATTQDDLRQEDPEIEFLEDALTVPVSKSKFPSYSPLTQVRFSDGNSENCMSKTRHRDGIHYGCSSLKSYKNTGQGEAGECSSSGCVGEDISAKDFCVSTLKDNGLLEESWHTRNCDFVDKEIGTNQLCKVCGKSGPAVRMLICDQCEEASHTYCCNILEKKKIPVDDEWFCPSCLKQKRKFLKDTTRRRQTKINSGHNCRSSSSNSDSNPILKMLRASESYISRVPIGANFQAEIPDWSGLTIRDGSRIREPDEIDPSQCIHELNPRKPFKLGSIGNWLQCRAEGVDGTVCGKWRRAPLSEAQTADWECFSCISWDPSRADCAVPQELETGEIMKQLKYIEMLRPQLDAKRRKVEGSRGSASENSAEAKSKSN